MHAKHFSKNIGQLFKLRPPPWRFDDQGRRLSNSEDLWKLLAVDHNPLRIALKNISTGHVLELEWDNVIGRRSPDFLLLRCQVLIRPDSIAVEPIHGSVMIAPAEPKEDQSKAGPGLVNAPAGYERQLNYHRYRILKDRAARSPTGGYLYPVRLKGPDAQIRAFCREFNATLGVFPTITRSTNGVTELEFTYSGTAAPEMVENLAITHHITVLQCGKDVTIS